MILFIFCQYGKRRKRQVPAFFSFSSMISKTFILMVNKDFGLFKPFTTWPWLLNSWRLLRILWKNETRGLWWSYIAHLSIKQYRLTMKIKVIPNRLLKFNFSISRTNNTDWSGMTWPAIKLIWDLMLIYIVTKFGADWFTFVDGTE